MTPINLSPMMCAYINYCSSYCLLLNFWFTKVSAIFQIPPENHSHIIFIFSYTSRYSPRKLGQSPPTFCLPKFQPKHNLTPLPNLCFQATVPKNLCFWVRSVLQLELLKTKSECFAKLFLKHDLRRCAFPLPNKTGKTAVTFTPMMQF